MKKYLLGIISCVSFSELFANENLFIEYIIGSTTDNVKQNFVERSKIDKNNILPFVNGDKISICGKNLGTDKNLSAFIGKQKLTYTTDSAKECAYAILPHKEMKGKIKVVGTKGTDIFPFEFEVKKASWQSTFKGKFI